MKKIIVNLREKTKALKHAPPPNIIMIDGYTTMTVFYDGTGKALQLEIDRED